MSKPFIGRDSYIWYKRNLVSETTLSVGEQFLNAVYKDRNKKMQVCHVKCCTQFVVNDTKCLSVAFPLKAKWL